MVKTWRVGAIALGAAAVGLCGCDDNNFDNFSADPSGVYEGTLTDNVTHATTSVFLIIDETGFARMSAADGTYYQLNSVSTDGNNFFANLTGFSSQAAFPNGSLTTTGRVVGGVTVPGLTLAYTAAGSDSGSIDLNFDNVYLQASSLPTLAGTYTSTTASPTLNLTVTTAGVITGTDSNGCTYAGNFSLVDPTLNAYEEHFTQTCNTTVVSFVGAADFVPASTSGMTTTPAQIHLLADDDNGHFIAKALTQGS